MPSINNNHGYNLGLIFLQAGESAHERIHGKLHHNLNNLSLLNEQNKHLHNLISKLSEVKKTKKADFTNDEEFQESKRCIDELDPYVFGHSQSLVWNSEDGIEITLQRLDSKVRMQVADISALNSEMGQDHEDKIQLTDIVKRSLDEHARHNESIISKQRQR